MKTEFKNAKVTVEKRCHGKQPAVFIIENDRVYMITPTPDGDFNITDEGIVGERYDESGIWCGEEPTKGCLVKPYCYGDFPELKEIELEIKNLTTYWLDKDTFCFRFDGGTDQNDDDYSFLCEYHKDEDEFVFVRCYEHDTTDANFTEEQKEHIKLMMKKYINSSLL